jgi:hypothetical protein
MPRGEHRSGDAERDRPAMSRRLGWGALIAAVAATAIFVPPLVMPKAHPGTPTTAAASSPTPSTAPTPTPSAGATSAAPSTTPGFRTISVHAADPANVRNGARVIECASCDGGRRVGYIGGPNILAVHVRAVPTAGNRTLTITYETEEPRTLDLTVNAGPVHTFTLTGAKSLVIPATVSLRVYLPAGDSWIKFFNDAGSAPDINKIAIS